MIKSLSDQEQLDKLVARIASNYAKNAFSLERDSFDTLNTLTDLCLMAPSSRPEEMYNILLRGLKNTLNK